MWKWNGEGVFSLGLVGVILVPGLSVQGLPPGKTPAAVAGLLPVSVQLEWPLEGGTVSLNCLQVSRVWCTLPRKGGLSAEASSGFLSPALTSAV